MFSFIIDWLVRTISVLGYPGVAIAMFLESFFAPIPSELILSFSGFVCSNNKMNIYITIGVATFAAYLGTLPFYVIGRWGKSSVDTFLKKFGKYLFISVSDIEKGYTAFNKYGNGIVFLGRLIPIIRTVISFPAGIAKMNFFVFSLYTFLGTLIWSTILSFAGFLLGENWEKVVIYVSKYEKIIYIALFILFILFIGRWIYKTIKKN